MLSLAFAYLWMLFSLKKEDNGNQPEPTRRRAWPAYLSTVLLAVLVAGDSLLAESHPQLNLPLGAVSVVACLPVYLLSPSAKQAAKPAALNGFICFPDAPRPGRQPL